MPNPNLVSVPITISVPKWMRDYIRASPELKASKLFQEAIIARKEGLGAYTNWHPSLKL